MHANELHKFSDDTLDDVQTALNDIAKGIRMEYLPKRKWSGLDKRRARVMVQDIDKQLYERRLMRNGQYDFAILCPILFQENIVNGLNTVSIKVKSVRYS
ncbi:hypothetical protein Tco_0191747 [Tanacetum coccineum]